MSCDSCTNVANVVRIKMKIRYNRGKVVRHSHECRATVIRFQMKIRCICGKVVRHSNECHATVVRIKMKRRCIREKVVRHSRECRATVVRQSRDYRTTVVRYIFKIRPKFANSMRLQHERCVYIVNLCCEIFANYSGTSLLLSLSSEIGA